jgi:hypothetical protein
MSEQTSQPRPVQNPLTLIMKIKSEADYEQLNRTCGGRDPVSGR